jgi:hypothetical protein
MGWQHVCTDIVSDAKARDFQADSKGSDASEPETHEKGQKERASALQSRLEACRKLEYETSATLPLRS